MGHMLERGLFASRWLLAPIYVGLAAALAMLVYAFGLELWHFAADLPAMTPEKAIIGALALIDLSLVANLMVIVIFSGYENFVSRMDIADHADRPDWQGEVDFSGLKLKLVASIVAISGIQLLKAFMELDDYSPDKIRWMAIIHVVFVVSGVLLALMDWITARSKAAKAK